MGTPEFPDLGKHCTVEDCRQIDFLPFICDGCKQVYCLEHRSFTEHHCPKADKNDVTVVICPLCARGVRLIPDQDPNISWENHVNTECDPSNYDKVTKKKRCPVPRCKEVLTFSNTIKCKDCMVDHCLKHRFGLDHKCPGPKKPEAGFPFKGFLSRSTTEVSKTKRPPQSSSPKSSSGFFTKLSSEISQAWNNAWNDLVQSSGNGQVEECPHCGAKLSSVATLVEHVQKVHEKGGSLSGVKKIGIDVCPKCSRGFRDPASLVQHVERDHGGASKA